ncbi:MAG: PfkB domain protein [Thermoleophilia bacterium]|jgi:ribokinase|nr:PfkB domain protein [Thermoleophilia bacterium]
MHPMPRVLVTGFISIDFIAHVAGFASAAVPEQAKELDVACGGRAANQAMALAAIETQVELLARVGSDEHASLLTDELLEIGVGTEFVQQSPSMTGIRLVAEQADGTRQVTVFRGANDYLTVDDLNRRAESIRDFAAVGVTTEPAGAVSVRALEIAQAAGVPTVLTHAPSAKPLSDRVLAAAGVVVASDSTCSGLLDPGVAREHPEAALRALVQRGARAAILLTKTRALLATGSDVREVASPGRLDSEDAVDAFVAGLLQGLSVGDGLEPSVLRGVRIAALLVD